MGRVARIAALLLLVVLVGYFAISGLLAFRDLNSARSDLTAAREQLVSDPASARQSLEAAQSAAASAAGTLNNPVWSALAAIPWLGATPKSAAVVSQSLDEALTALQPGFDKLDILQPASLVKDGGIDISAVEEAVPVAESALPGIQQARATLDEAPTSGLLPGQVRDATQQLAQQLDSLESTLSTAVSFGRIAGPMLGQESPQRYFLALLNPNEARGTGGFLGTYAVLTADNGKLSIDQIGSNTSLPNLEALPASIGREFRDRYADDPTLVGNMNLSPHLPDSGAIWLAAWKQKTGQQLDGVIAVDVVALGDLVASTERPVALPDGGQITGGSLSQFTLRDIYTKFPDAAVRKAYQEALTGSALASITTLPKPLQMAEALGRALADHRMVIWTRDPAVEDELVQAGVSGTLVVPDGHYVKPVVLNASGSKLDAWLSRSIWYDVGRCVEAGRVKSSVSASLRSDVPLGVRPDPYMIGSARMGPNGPVNFSMLQVHLPNGAQLGRVTVDGERVDAFEFTEQGRPAAMVALELPPRETKRVTFEFTEPESDGPGQVEVQPLADTPDVVIANRECDAS